MKILFRYMLVFGYFWSFPAFGLEQKAGLESRQSKLSIQKVKKSQKILIKSVNSKKNNSKKTTQRSVSDADQFMDWQEVPILSTPDLIMYENKKKNSKMLLSFQREKGIPASERQDISSFFEKTEEQKMIILSASRLKNITLTSNRMINQGDMSLIYMEGSYTSVVKDKKVFFEEWQIYSNEITYYLLFSNLGKPIEDFASIESFIKQWLSFTAFSASEKHDILAFVQG